MDQTNSPRSLTRFAPMAGFAAGALVALAIAALPQWRLEAAVSASGVDGFLAAARPPLGATARSALALTSGGAVATLVWAVLTFGARLLSDGSLSVESDVPVLRKADAHPDAPSRRPLRASEDLGQPLRIAPIELAPAAEIAERIVVRTVPVDLDTPLAAVDPAAIPDVPREPVRPVAPLAKPAVAEETIETFELTPIRRTAKPQPDVVQARATSLAAMLDRLEQGASRRGSKPAPSLDETLGMLRGLATR